MLRKGGALPGDVRRIREIKTTALAVERRQNVIPVKAHDVSDGVIDRSRLGPDRADVKPRPKPLRAATMLDHKQLLLKSAA
jgi:hypothetical protein